MKKAALQIAALAGILLLICVGYRLTTRDAYMAYYPVPQGAARGEAHVRVEAETPGVVNPGEPTQVGGYLRVPIHPQGPGQAFVDIGFDGVEDSVLGDFHVGRFNTVYDSRTGGFTGDSIVLVSLTVFFLAVAAIMFRVYRQSRGPAFYAYSTIYAVGFSLFSLVTGLTMLVVTVRHFADLSGFAMRSAYSVLASASFQFMLVTLPLLLTFAVAMAVSNVALLRHERFRVQNVLGIVVSVLLVAGEALGLYLYTRDFSGSEVQWRVRSTLQNVYAAGFAYFECMLIGAIVCGLKAAKHVPAQDVDYILILGCRFRKDGSLPPLLRGRVDRAIDFWREQRRATGREAVLVPSGGQGPDESMAEAEAMRRYLVGQGVPEASIRVEDQSRNTYQNMEFSKKLIDGEKPGAKVAYATTNYHVFRSGVWAALAGLPAEGMGSDTKWWFWPNAFMRECAGLLRNRIRQEIVLLAAMAGFFGLLSMALG